MATVAVAARIPDDYARALDRIAVLGGTTRSKVLANLVTTTVQPLPASDGTELAEGS